MRKAPFRNNFGLKLFTLSVFILLTINMILSTDIRTDMNVSSVEIDDADFRNEPKAQSIDNLNNFTGTGTSWNVTHYANRTNQGAEYFIENNNYNDEYEELILPKNWYGTKLIANITNLEDLRNWCNGTFEFGYDGGNDDITDNDNEITAKDDNNQNWTYYEVDIDTGDSPNSFENPMSGNYYDSDHSESEGRDCLVLEMEGEYDDYSDPNPHYGYDNRDRCGWYTEFKVPRGEVSDAKLSFDVRTLNISEVPGWELIVHINNKKVWSMSTLTLVEYLEYKWNTIDVLMENWVNDTAVFEGELADAPTTINISLEVTGGLTFAGASFDNISHQRLLIDDVQLLTKAAVKPSQINLRLNKTYEVFDQNNQYGKGSALIEGNWDGNRIEYIKTNFSSMGESKYSGGYNVSLITDLTLFAERRNDHTYYAKSPSAIGSQFSVSNDTKVRWQWYALLSTPNDYEIYETKVICPSDFNYTWVFSADKPSINVTNTEIVEHGTIIIPIQEVSVSPNGFWKFKAVSPNYCENLQIQNNNTGLWLDSNSFIGGDYINITAKIRKNTLVESYIEKTHATLQIRFPNGSLWEDVKEIKKLDDSGSGDVRFSPFKIPDNDGYNYSVGEYKAIITWNNSYSSLNLNETGMIYKVFTVSHNSSLTPSKYYYGGIEENSIINLEVSFYDLLRPEAITDANVYVYNLSDDTDKIFFNPGLNPGEYELDLNVSGAEAGEVNIIRIFANSSTYVNEHVDIGVQVIAETTLTSNQSIITVPWNQNFSVYFNFTEITSGDGIETILTHNWKGDNHTQQIGTGEYKLICNSSKYEINKQYSLIIRANKYGYRNQTLLLKIKIVQREMNITRIYFNSEPTTNRSISLSSGELLNITIELEDILNEVAVQKASVNATWSGFEYEFDENFTFNQYNFTLNTSKLELGATTSITIIAKKQNYESVSRTITVSVGEVATELRLILNGEDKTSEREIQMYTNQSLNITVTYKTRLNPRHVSGASVELIGAIEQTIPPDPNLPQYNMTLNTSKLEIGNNIFTVYANREEYTAQSILFVVKIIDIQTNIELYVDRENRTIDRTVEMTIGAQLNVTIIYKDNDTKNRISKADIKLIGEGLDLNLTEKESLKQYSILINSSNLNFGKNRITFFATKEGYESQNIGLTIFLVNIKTRLDLLLNDVNKTSDTDKYLAITYGKTVNISAIFRFNETAQNISKATVQLKGEGLSIELNEKGDHYYYIIDTTSLSVDVFYFSITATKTNYTSQTYNFRIIVISRKTNISNYYLNKIERTYLEINWNARLNITLNYFDRLELSTISSATIRLTGSGISESLEYNPSLDFYNISLNSKKLGFGIKYLTISCEKGGYESQSLQITVKVIKRQTTMSLIINGTDKTLDPSIEIPISRDIGLNIRYSDVYSGGLVSLAYIQITGEGLNLTYTSNPDGSLSVVIKSIDLDIGTKYLTILASKENYSDASEILKITVRRIKAEVVPKSGQSKITLRPGESTTVELLLNNTDFKEDIKNAIIRYTWQFGQGELTDEDGDGIYDLSLTFIPEGTHEITITVYAGDNYEFDRFVIEINAIRPPGEALLFQVSTIIGIGAAVAVGGYLILYQKKLKYPKPVRKVRSLRKKFKKDSALEDVEITSRNNAFNELHALSLAPISKALKLKAKGETKEEIKTPTTDKFTKKTTEVKKVEPAEEIKEVKKGEREKPEKESKEKELEDLMQAREDFMDDYEKDLEKERIKDEDKKL